MSVILWVPTEFYRVRIPGTERLCWVRERVHHSTHVTSRSWWDGGRREDDHTSRLG